MGAKYQIRVFGKQGCDKCHTLNQRLDKLLAKEEYGAFEKLYCDVETIDGLVAFAEAECINPARIPAMLELVGMRDAADRKIREYSKGMVQRVGLAQALIHEPELVILDEPTDGVDPVDRAAVRQIVQNLKDKGTTVFINSHLLMEVEMICDDIVILKDGEVLRRGRR